MRFIRNVTTENNEENLGTEVKVYQVIERKGEGPNILKYV